jgi:hypothetical protein
MEDKILHYSIISPHDYRESKYIFGSINSKPEVPHLADGTRKGLERCAQEVPGTEFMLTIKEKC